MAEGNLCDNCDKCCKYVALEIDKPESQKDIDQIKWFLVHQDVWIFIDHDDSWNIQFNTSCEKLDDGLCSIYEERPRICRDYSSDNCEKYGVGDSFKILWKNLKSFEDWLGTNKKFSGFS